MNDQENENEVEECVTEEENCFDSIYYEEIKQEIKIIHENIEACKGEFNQNEQIIQEKIKENEELKKENINLNQEVMYELECRGNVLKSFSATDGVIQNFVEKKNTLQDMIEIYESDVARSELLNQKIATNLEKLVEINREKLNKYDVEYKELNQNLQAGKKKIEELKDNFATIKKTTEDKTDDIKNRIIKLQEKKDHSKREHELIHKQIMDVNSESLEIFNKTEEIKLAFDNFLQEKAQKKGEFEKKIMYLNEVSRNKQIELKSTESELESLQGANRNQKELQNHLNTQNEEMKNKIFQNKKTMCALNEELKNMKQTYGKETEDSIKMEENVKSEIKEIRTKIFKMENENKQLQEKHLSLNTEINTISASLKKQKLNYISMEHEENNLKEAQKNENDKLKEMVNALQLSQEMENKSSLELNTEKELCQNDILKLDETLASYQNQYEKLCNEARVEETEINFNIDALNENKGVLQNKLQERCKKLRDIDSCAEILTKEEENNKRDLQKIINHSNLFKNEAERMRKLAEQKYNRNLSKLERATDASQINISKMQAQRDKFRKDLNLRVKELNDLRAKMYEIKPDIKQQDDLSKKVTFKKPMYQEFQLPELKVPPSNYSSSTSFSDSSFSSVENDSKLKKRREYLKKQRNKAKKADSSSPKTNQKQSVSSSQKELDDLFDSLRE